LEGDEDLFVSLLPLGTGYSPSYFGFQLDVSGDCSLYQSESGQFQLSTGSFGYDLYADYDLYIECNDMTDGYYRYIYYEVDLMDSCCQEIDLFVTYIPSPEAGCPSQVVASTTVSCVCGCTDINACNYDDMANFDQFSSCDYGCLGCTDEQACNYDQTATMDDGTCASCEALATACGEGTVWDTNTSTCIVANPADINLDGCVQLNDLLDLLTAYGDCAAEGLPWQCGDPLEYQGYDYETVQIGEQCWFAENLRTENYRNGDAIPSGLSDSEWDNTDYELSGATAVYGEGSSAVNTGNDDAFSNLSMHGRLYNFFAVSDERTICPVGWLVPSTTDFETLLTEVGNTDALKGLESSSGFDSTFGGRRTGLGSFYYESVQAAYWTQIENIDNPGDAFNYILGQNESTHYPNSSQGVWDSTSMKVGFSVRCIKN